MRFVELIGAENVQAANKMLLTHKSRSKIGHQVGDLEHWRAMKLQSGSRKAVDVSTGRCNFQMVEGNFRLIVERTHVILPDEPHFVWIGQDKWISLRSDGVTLVDSKAISQPHDDVD